MAVTKKNVNGIFYFTYPSSDVFLKERNYFIFEAIKQSYITSIKIGSKTLNFGGELDIYKPFYLDVSAYYAKYNGKFSVTIYFNSEVALGDSTTITINATIYDCYDPFKEITGTICNETGMAIITPPNRMLMGSDSVKSLFCAKRAAGTSVISVRWNINGVDDGSVMIRKNVSISNGSPFVAKYIQRINAQSLDVTLSTITRSVDVRDGTRDCVYVTWRTRWGLDVSHVFYLDTYATDKDDAKEVESEYLYKEHSKHVIKGSFYLDNIREPYDLWYYQTLDNSELVTLTFDRWGTLPATYMPNGTNDFNGVKITGCNIKDAMVDGVAQSTITFDFEMR